MATIKRNGAKVVLKDGKVACGCCEEPSGCCMYPAQALFDGLYTADDLPDDVTVGGMSLARSGSGYGNTTSGVLLEGNVWARYANGVRSERPCLIQGGVEDQFADTYTISGEGAAGAVVSRISLCEWQGIDGCGNRAILRYAEENVSSSPWNIIELGIYQSECIPDTLNEGFKDGDASTPVGEYIGQLPMTVS